MSFCVSLQMPSVPRQEFCKYSARKLHSRAEKAVVVAIARTSQEVGQAMKLGTQTHPKFKSLQKSLCLSSFQTVGVLESLWMMTCQYAGDDGDLSRFTPQEIADWMEWGGDAKELIDALKKFRWLDSDGDSMRVHDWQDHKPHYLKDRERKRIQGGSRSFQGGSEPRQAKPRQSTKDLPKV